MLNVSISLFRIFGNPQLHVGRKEGSSYCFKMADTRDEFPESNGVLFHVIECEDHEKIERAIAAFNEVISGK